MTSLSPTQELAERVVHEMAARDTFSAWMGINILAIEPGSVSIEMRVRSDMLNGFGTCHGGIPFALADSALAFASNTNGFVTMSIDNHITYPVRIQEGDQLTAIATEETTSRRLGYYRVVITNQANAIVGLFQGTVYHTRTPHFPPAPSGVV